ncbi:MAG: CerR family C-terminal domain-containing protein [Thiohalocapsa sp.]|nr:CerR family C-terminal domain-containing protein [Thiohalocapsa sp.]
MIDRATANSTRERLLQAALQVFAEHGYEAATIREICGRAEANVAAVHYHFGDKRKLYQAIFGTLFETLRERRTAFLPSDAPAEERLRVYIRALFEEIFCCNGDPERQVQLSTIYLSEMAHPTEVLDRIVEEHLEPDARELYSIVAELLGGAAHESLIVDCAAGVVGQILYYYHAGPIISRLHPEQAPVSQRIDALVQQVWQFSLGGIDRAAPGTARDRAGADIVDPNPAEQPSDDISDQGC